MSAQDIRCSVDPPGNGGIYSFTPGDGVQSQTIENL